MNCCLWFNRRKISSAVEIPGNLDIAALRGYFLGGSLIEWLREHDGENYAERLEQLDPADPDLNQRLAEIFGQSEEKSPEKEIFRGNASAADIADQSACGSFGGSFVSGSANWLSGSFKGYFPGSFSYGSFGGSWNYGSYSKFLLWEWEWEWRFGGSLKGSFRRISSFSGGSSGFGFLNRTGLFGSFGSYNFGSWAYLTGSFRGFGTENFAGVYGSGGSFGGWQEISSDEYDRIMYECLRRCPLDCFGYGVHIV